MPQWPWRKPRPGVDEYGRSPLWYHVADGDITALRRDLKAGLNSTAADKDGFTALHVAAQNGRAEALDMLIRAGADVNATDRHGNGPLWTAGYEAAKAIATDANMSIVAMLLKAGADPHRINKAGRSPIFWASVNPRLQEVYNLAGIAAPVGP